MVDGASAIRHDSRVDMCLGRWMWSAAGACPRSWHRVWCRAIAAVRVALLFVLALAAAAAWMPAAHAVMLRLRGGTVDRAITVGRAVDTVLMDGVYITNGVAVVFDVAAMLPRTLRIELRNCVCDGGAQIYVRGYSGEPASDRSLEVSVSGLSGSYCSLVFVHNLPARTNVTVRDLTIVTPGPMRYSQLGGLTDAVASPLVLHATSLLQTQLRVSSTVLRSSQAGGLAVHVGGGVDLLSSAVRCTWTGCWCSRSWGCACRWGAVLRPVAAPWWRLLTATSCCASTRCLCVGL
ncbi:dispersed gene family protein 1 (DGF-1) [Trypanosoma cruzi]|nr:dispersed gene family protein 1 (DGF-1) [Trypanosoma cruzi]